MISPLTRARLAGLATYLLAAFALLFWRLMPVSPGGIGWPGPDLLLALTMMWIMRRPDQLPALAVAITALIEDLVLMRPPGLWAGIMLLGSEAARNRRSRWREHGFMIEWLRVSVLMGMMMLAARIAQIMVMLPVPPLGMVLMQLIATILAYPAVALFGRMIPGLSRVSAAEAERLGVQ